MVIHWDNILVTQGSKVIVTFNYQNRNQVFCIDVKCFQILDQQDQQAGDGWL